MIRNYLRVAFRHAARNKAYSLINIIGLAIGMACCILIAQYVAYELSYDNYHLDGDRIFRVAEDGQSQNERRIAAVTSAPMAPALKEDYPQIEYAARMLRVGNLLVKRNEKVFYEERCWFAETDLPRILTIPFLEGDSQSALERPTTVVISQRLARKYFGDESPIGQILNVQGFDLEVTGVTANCPQNTHVKHEMLISFSTLEATGYGGLSNWFLCNFYTYVKLAPNTDLAAFSEQLKGFAERHVGEELKASGETLILFLQPVGSIHLHSHLIGETEPSGSPLYLYIFCTVGFFILLLACINFTNLTTARFAGRAREVGLRKAVGAGRFRLAAQFLSESVILSAFALVVALVLVELTSPLFNQLTGIGFHISSLIQPAWLLALAGLAIVVGIASGSYPAFFLSAFHPAVILRGTSDLGRRGTILRKILVVGQFSISIVLVIGTLLAYQQIHFMKSENLGFEKEQKLVVPLGRAARAIDSFESVKTEFSRHTGVVGATASAQLPGQHLSCWTTKLATESDEKLRAMNYMYVDHDFIPQYGIKVLAGSAFGEQNDDDLQGGYIINQTSAEQLGFSSPQEALGKRLVGCYDEKQMEIIGVVGDFHYRGLQSLVEPLVMLYRPRMFRNVTLNVRTEDAEETVAFAKGKWQELFPEYPFDYFFLDTSFDRQYRAEERVGKIFAVFTFLGLFIACLGLLALASYAAERRTKEIGIRKVLGASVGSIVGLLSREFLLLVAIANLIAWPIAYLAMSRWLEEFAYRINIGLGTFLLAAAFALIVTLITVSTQAIRAALTNPVDTLRYE
jgi:putative ABC transport system permease protein